LIYGSLGTLNFNDLSLLLSFNLTGDLENLNIILISGILLVVFTLLFKISAAPFHF
jgi:NADH:ubiquinone oxidoreductase subunit 2 (subunit N)